MQRHDHKETTMRVYLLPMLILSAACLVGCHHDDGGNNFDTVTNYISIHDGSIAVHAPGHADADITAAGDLSIANKSIPVTPAQRDLLKHYYAAAMATRDHGIATGKAGMDTAGTALRSVASGLASGNTDKIDTEVNASAAKVEAQVALICNDLADIHATQETLASQLADFRPYALIKASEATDCQRGLKHKTD
jgi:hypothetical protein